MREFKFKVDEIREQFPALSKTVNGIPAAFLDGPGGTQVPRRVVEKINDYLYYRNANSHGVFKTSLESDNLYWQAREVYADFLNCSAEEVAFGANTSSNNFKLALGLVRTMKPGDEVLITDIDHEGNRSPWRTLEDFGIIVKSVKINTETITLDFEDFKAKLSDKTKVFAVNWAANSCGTISDVKKFIDEAHKVGAITVVDAVHYAPHRPIDVKAIDTDILLCSAYKFFGPHFGVMYVKKSVGEMIKTVRVIADDNTEMPFKFETGTPAMELAAGAAEAVEFIADIGNNHEEFFEAELKGLSGRRRFVVAGMMAIDKYEEGLAVQLRTELAKLPGVKVFGPGPGHPRTSTVSFNIEGVNSNEVAKYLAEKGIFVWDGDYYAIETITNVLKLEASGGLVRIGLAPYNIQSEIDRTIVAIQEFCETIKS
ncbi:MAG: cysteine desulfurase-like protein [Peptostreptococcaceae bacterium]|nr:cysteine desulfurase-like protein [Peptostreptococcaceae bacterium]